jgi:hypothetical protein
MRRFLAPTQVKARREEYEREREEREAKRIEDQRQREAELHGDWQEKEEQFHRIQQKRRWVGDAPFCAVTSGRAVFVVVRGRMAMLLLLLRVLVLEK